MESSKMNAERAKQAMENADCLYTAAQVEAALDDLATSMAAVIADTDPVVVCVMNGGLILTAALMKRWEFPMQLDYLHATRYGAETRGGPLQWHVSPQMSCEDRTVVLLDDIFDEGVTLFTIAEHYRKKNAARVYSAVLLENSGNGKSATRWTSTPCRLRTGLFSGTAWTTRVICAMPTAYSRCADHGGPGDYRRHRPDFH